MSGAHYALLVVYKTMYHDTISLSKFNVSINVPVYNTMYLESHDTDKGHDTDEVGLERVSSPGLSHTTTQC